MNLYVVQDTTETRFSTVLRAKQSSISNFKLQAETELGKKHHALFSWGKNIKYQQKIEPEYTFG